MGGICRKAWLKGGRVPVPHRTEAGRAGRMPSARDGCPPREADARAAPDRVRATGEKPLEAKETL